MKTKMVAKIFKWANQILDDITMNQWNALKMRQSLSRNYVLSHELLNIF
jgi:hypothetical protein